ncbi:MAG: hypothetical protein EGP82_00035 [Odoribacter splanchnicus]|nr:hypothetical protein [Odoribacter splanchnicus]
MKTSADLFLDIYKESEKKNLVAYSFYVNPSRYLFGGDSSGLIILLNDYVSDKFRIPVDEISPELKNDALPWTDARFVRFELQGMKCFPYSSVPFGIRFYKGKHEEKPESLVLLGRNGVGKSSIFDVMEWILTNKIGECSQRNYNNPQSYLEHITMKKNITVLQEPSCSLLRKDSGEYCACLSNSFISEYDVNHIGQLAFTKDEIDPEHPNDLNLHAYIARTLSYLEHYNVVYQLIKIKSNLDNVRNEVRKNKDELAKKLANIQANVVEVVRKQGEGTDFLEQSLNDAYYAPDDATQEMEKWQYAGDLIINCFEEVLDKYNKWYVEIINTRFIDIVKYINIIMKKVEPNESCEVVSEIEGPYLYIGLKVDGKEECFSPRKYYNTFRFKLFCMSLKAALAFCAQRLHHVNTPLILDDVFYASDFDNRILVKNFFMQLYRMHFELLDVKYPLQIICFTHDELIFESLLTISAEDFVEMKDKEESGEIIQRPIYGRLLHYNEAITEETKGGNKFKNLYWEYKS